MGESPFFAVCFRGAVCGLSAAPKAAACEKPGPSGPGHVPALPARPAAFALCKQPDKTENALFRRTRRLFWLLLSGSN